MKRKILLLLAVFAVAMTVEAQDKMVIKKTDGSLLEIPVLEIEKIYFTSENNGGDGQGEIKNEICGSWYCVYQYWTQDGEEWSETYSPSSEYCMCFNEDGTGYMMSGSDELFEIGCHGTPKNFNWYVEGNKLFTDVYHGQMYTVNSLNGNELEMTWRDEDADYTIICRFVRQ